MSRLVRTSHPGLMKDLSTGMVINTNTGEYSRALAARRRAILDREKDSDVESLKAEVREIKSMLSQILRAISDVDTSA
jgi:hypothetical protein